VTEHLRPLERRVLALQEDGHDVDEIARRFKRSPEHVERILNWAEIPRSGPSPRLANRAKERRILALRHEGEDHSDIGERFRRSPEFIRRVEGFAHYRRAMEILDG
jgi:hypothetical protein